MQRRRRNIYLAIAVGLVLVGLTVVLVCFVFNRSFENDAMVVTWERGGEPWGVDGTVTCDAKPVAGQYVEAETESGGTGDTTDANGNFSIGNLGDPEIIAFEVRGKGKIEWNSLFGLSISNGVRFQVDLK